MKIYSFLTQILEQPETTTAVDSLKTCQILVFNLALYGQGDERLWDALIGMYKDKLIEENRYNSGSYHIFSLIGFMMRQNYTKEEQSQEFDERINSFIVEYKNFCK